MITYSKNHEYKNRHLKNRHLKNLLRLRFPCHIFVSERESLFHGIKRQTQPPNKNNMLQLHRNLFLYAGFHCIDL